MEKSCCYFRSVTLRSEPELLFRVPREAGCEGTVVSGVHGSDKGTGPVWVAVLCIGTGTGVFPVHSSAEGTVRVCLAAARTGAGERGVGSSPFGQAGGTVHLCPHCPGEPLTQVMPRCRGQGNSSSGQPPQARRKGEWVGRRQAV